MAQNIFKLDNTYYNVRIPEKGIKRSGQVLDGDGSKRYQSGTMERDIIGTYYNYTIELDTSELSTTDYDLLYEAVTAPVAYHSIQVPYGQTTLAFNAYITSAEDTLINRTNSTNKWGGLSLKFIAVSPART